MSGWEEDEEEDGCLELGWWKVAVEQGEGKEDEEGLGGCGDVSRSYHEGDLILEVFHPQLSFFSSLPPSFLLVLVLFSPLPRPSHVLFFSFVFFFSIFAVLHFSDYKKIQSPPVEWCSHRAIFNVPIENIETFVNTQLIRSIGKIQTLVGSPDKNMIKRINGINQTGGNLDSVFSMNLMARCRL